MKESAPVCVCGHGSVSSLSRISNTAIEAGTRLSGGQYIRVIKLIMSFFQNSDTDSWMLTGWSWADNNQDQPFIMLESKFGKSYRRLWKQIITILYGVLATANQSTSLRIQLVYILNNTHLHTYPDQLLHYPSHITCLLNSWILHLVILQASACILQITTSALISISVLLYFPLSIGLKNEPLVSLFLV